MMPNTGRAITIIGIIAAFLGGVVVGQGRAPASSSLTNALRNGNSASRQGGEIPDAIDLDLLREVWDVVHEKYAGPLDDSKLASGVLRGLVAGLGDPYSAFADKEETSQFSDEISGSFTGIGVEIGVRRGLLTVIAPLKKSPAEKAGIRARDIIIAVDGENVTLDTSLTDIVAKIRGPAGTRVTLKVLREETEEPLTFEVRRERISIESVTHRVERGVGVIEVSAFHDDTARRFRTAVRDLLSANVRRIVLDLRNNPGGILQSAVDIAGHFVDDGQLVVREVPAKPDDALEHRANGPGDLRNVPVVVVVNGGSASASEILAGVLRDVRKTLLIGEQTFGKGTVQELVDLRSGASVRVTVAKWVTPSGKELTEEGLAPDVEIVDENPDDEDDVVLEGAIDKLLEQR